MRLWFLWTGLLGCAFAAQGDDSTALAHAEQARQLTLDARYREAIVEWRKALRLAPENPVFHNLYGLALQQAGEAGAAQAEFRRALRLNPAFRDAQNNLAYSLWQGGESDLAAVAADRALRLSPEDGSLHLLRGEMFAEAAQPVRACREFKRATPWQRDAATLWRILESCLGAGDRSAYLRAAGGLTESAPADARMHLNIGAWLLRGNQAGDAIPFLSRADVHAPLLLAEAYLASCEPQKALDALSDLEPSEASLFQVQDLRGSALLALGRKSEAEAAFHLLVERFPNAPESYIAATQVALQENHWDSVLRLLNEGLAHLPNNWLLLFRRGVTYKLSGQLQPARADLMAALQANGDVSLVAAALGDLEAETGDLSSAAELFRDTWRTTKLPQFGLAYAVALDRLGKSPQALKELRELALDQPGDAQVHYSLGKVLAHQGLTREALAEFEKVRAVEPEMPGNLYALGHAYLVLGKPEKARAIMADFQAAKQRTGASPAAAPCRPPVESARSDVQKR